MTRHLDKFYRDAREAMLMALRDGYVQAEPLAAMQAMANMAPNREAFGAARYNEMRSLVDAIEHLLSKLEEGQSMNEWRTKGRANHRIAMPGISAMLCHVRASAPAAECRHPR